jgi:hypothetical protein
MWSPLAIVCFLVTSTNEYLLQDVMSDSIMIKNSLNKVMILTPTSLSIYLTTMFWKNKQWHTYSGTLYVLLLHLCNSWLLKHYR